MTARRFLSWPSDIREANKQDRTIVLRAEASESVGGIDDSTNLRAGGKRTYDSVYIMPSDSHPEWRVKWAWLNGKIGRDTRIYYTEPCERWLDHVRAGPPSDGVREVFPVPLIDATDGPYAYAGGVWDEAALFAAQSGNVLTDNMAIAIDDLTGLTNLNACSLSRTSAYRYYYGSGLQMTPDGTVTNFGFRTDPVPCPATWPVTAVFWAQGTVTHNMRAQLLFYDALLAPIGIVLPGPLVEMKAGIWTPVYHTEISPSNAAYVSIRGINTETTNLPWWCDCRGGMLYPDPYWTLPSESLGAVKLSTPPAATDSVTISGEGTWKALCAGTVDRLGESVGSRAHLTVGLDLREVWEASSEW